MLKKLFLFAMLFSFLLGCSALDSVKDNSTLGSGTYYSLTFDSNGGSGDMPSINVNKGQSISLPLNTFQKANYEFIGWSLTANGNPLYQDGENITLNEDTVLYAYWIYKDSGGGDGETNPNPAVKYTIKFDRNGGSGYMEPIVVEKGSSIELTKNFYTRDGYSFAGWSKTADGTVDYNDEDVIAVTEDTTLYAVWNIVRQYKITYVSNTTDNKIKESYKYSPTGGNVVYLDANEFVNGNMKFIGWSTNKSSNRGEYQDKAPLSTLASDLTLYAVWDANPVVIKFNSNNGKGTMTDLYAKAGAKIILPTAEFTRDGYELLGSYTYYIYTLRFGSEFIVPDNVTEVELYTGWRQLPEPEQPIRGGNSEIYKDMDVWVDGVNVKQEDWVETGIKGLKYAKRRSDSGWYHTYQGDYNLCWAGAASNLLHWWYDRNKDSIENYFAYYASKDTIKPVMEYKGWGESTIFEHFKKSWPNKGYYINKGLIWYLLGDDFRANGGFFEEVFGRDAVFTESYGGLNQYKLNRLLEKAFLNKMGIGASEQNGFGAHAITIWGAHFNKDGFIDKIYVTDSGVKAGSNTPNIETGLLGIDIVYDFDSLFGRVYMKNFMGGLIPLNTITLFSNTKTEWQEYFDTHEPIR